MKEAGEEEGRQEKKTLSVRLAISINTNPSIEGERQQEPSAV